jgi:hypothetical protein
MTRPICDERSRKEHLDGLGGLVVLLLLTLAGAGTCCPFEDRSCFVVELLYPLDNLFRPCGSTLKFTLFQRTFGAFDEKAFR